MFILARPAINNATVTMYCLRGLRSWTKDASKARKFTTEQEAREYGRKSGIDRHDGFNIVHV
jgi:hypothetical protein